MPDTPKNDFLPFGIETGANVLKPEDYDGLAARKTGFVSGVAKSEELNTVWRQASVIAATFAQYIADRTGKDVLDDGDMAALLQLTKEALNAVQSVSAGNSTHKPDSSGNVKLGSAADADIVTSMTDTTAGRVPVVGWMGLGGAAPRSSQAANSSYDSIPAGLPSGFWTHTLSGGPFAYSFALQQDGGGVNNTRHFIMPADTNGKIAIRWDDGATFRYQYFYTDKNKPTPADVGAVDKKGDTMTGRLIMNVDGEAIRLQPKTAGYASYILSADSANANHWYVGAGSVGNADVAFNNYKGGNNSVVLKSDGTIYLNPTQGRSAIVNSPLQLGTTKKLTIESQNTSTLGAIIHLWGNADRPTVIEFGDDTSYHFYSQRNKDGSISFVSPGQVVPGNYTNFDSRYLGKSSTLTRLGAQVVVDVPNHQTVSAPAGCVQSAVRCGSDGALTGMGYRPLQALVNGSWVNVQSL